MDSLLLQEIGGGGLRMAVPQRWKRSRKRGTIPSVACERLQVKVRFKDGAAPAQALLVLVAYPSEMDGKVEMERQVRPPDALRRRVSSGPCRETVPLKPSSACER